MHRLRRKVGPERLRPAEKLRPAARRRQASGSTAGDGGWRASPKVLTRVQLRMRRASPAFIPRNHRVEAALKAASESDDLAPFQKLLQVVQRPYDDQPEHADYATPPEPSDQVYQTFCGT